MATEKKNIIIVGGGIIGVTTAYFLVHHPSFSPALHKITLIEANSLASAASGKAGGLLALWAYPSCIVPLSYRLHAELAAKHSGAEKWGYRTLGCGSVRAKAKVFGASKDGKMEGGAEWNKLPKTKERGKVVGNIPEDLDWIDSDTLQAYSEMGTPETTAQVHPYLFTNCIADLAVEAGARIIYGRVTAIKQNSNNVKGVAYEDKITKELVSLEATDIVLAAGPWTSQIFPAAPIEAVRAHSVVIRAPVSPYAVFSDISLPPDFPRRRHGATVTPEIYARPDGTVYACGEADSAVPLPPSSDDIVCDEERCQDVIDYIAAISTPLAEGEVLKKQACYLPSVEGGGGPLIGNAGVKGLWMATGHTCWGIQNSCATGKLISEFIFEGQARSARVHSLDPRRFL